MTGILGICDALNAADEERQRMTRQLIEEIALSALRRKDCEPAAVAERAQQKQSQALIRELKTSQEELKKKVEKFENQQSKKMGELGGKVDAAVKALSDLQTRITTKHGAIDAELAKLHAQQQHMREEFSASLSSAVAKERTGRLKLFSRWNEKHGSDVETLNKRMQSELSYLAQRSAKEFALQSGILEQLRDKLDYALMKRYGYIPETSRQGRLGTVGGYRDDEMMEQDDDDEKAKGATILSVRDHFVLRRPQLKGTFNLAVDAGAVISTLDNRIDALTGQVKDLAAQSEVEERVQSWDAIRRQRVRNDGSDDGSASESGYGDSSEEGSVHNIYAAAQAHSQAQAQARAQAQAQTQPASTTLGKAGKGQPPRSTASQRPSSSVSSASSRVVPGAKRSSTAASNIASTASRSSAGSRPSSTRSLKS